MNVRAVTPEDISRLGQIAEAAGLFPAEYVPDMIKPYLDGASDTWRTIDGGLSPVGFAFARLEELTDRTWNILAIAVEPEKQGQGYASRLLADIEAELDARVIVIETTQLPEQEKARAFYKAKGYELQGHVKDFFGDGEDKLIFRKAIQ
ncbi:MAG: GNAT family N-acetyltransferase [Pseudomonadota bacterium]